MLGVVVVFVLLLGGCAVVAGRALTRPTTQAELCADYAVFADEWFDYSTFDGGFDSRAFDAMEDLAGTAKRYPDNPAVKANGERLDSLAEGDGGFIVTVSVASAQRASADIAQECR